MSCTLHLAADYFQCHDGILLLSSLRCDGYPDCPHGEDERGCGGHGRSETPTECLSAPPRGWCPHWVQSSTRWFYNPLTASCSQFQYKCGSGVNNFPSLSSCRSFCQPGSSGQPPQPPFTDIQTRREFYQFVSEAANSLIEFYADWCRTCQTFSPQFEEAAASLQSLEVQSGRVTVTRLTSSWPRLLARQLGVTRLPYLVLIRNNNRSVWDLDSHSLLNISITYKHMTT